MDELFRLIGQPMLSSGPNSQKSNLSSEGDFFVRDLQVRIDNSVTTPVIIPTVQTKIVPLKVSTFVWRACLDCFPTSIALTRRGIITNTTSCLLCNVRNDEVYHIIVNSQLAWDALWWIFNQCRVHVPPVNTICDFVSLQLLGGGVRKKKQKIMIALCYDFIWCMWKARNTMRFNCVQTRSIIWWIMFLPCYSTELSIRVILLCVNGRIGVVPPFKIL